MQEAGLQEAVDPDFMKCLRVALGVQGISVFIGSNELRW